jgi:protease-4
MSDPTPGTSRPDERTSFEQALVSQIAREFLHEQRQVRRWGIFFKALLALYLLFFLLVYLADSGIRTASLPGDKHTALVDIEGVIAADAEASADHIVAGLRAAFESDRTAGIILRINSPGGSPVQAGYVNDEIHRLRKEYPDVPLYAVISDVCASGGYYIASAADKIYANKASQVGSIGVVMRGFGFVGTLEKLGIERRVRHAGDNKDFLDPFLPLREEDLRHVDEMLGDIHGQFIDVVKEGRGDRLKADEELFSGLVWTGARSLELGLVDGLGSASYVAREVIGAEDIVDFTRRDSYLDRFARQVGAAFAQSLSTVMRSYMQ